VNVHISQKRTHLSKNRTHMSQDICIFREMDAYFQERCAPNEKGSFLFQQMERVLNWDLIARTFTVGNRRVAFLIKHMCVQFASVHAQFQLMCVHGNAHFTSHSVVPEMTHMYIVRTEESLTSGVPSWQRSSKVLTRFTVAVSMSASVSMSKPTTSELSTRA
jgi:hypothetical protein